MKISCLCSVENYVSVDKPLGSYQDIHLGLAFIATSLKEAGFDIQLMVISPHTDFRKAIKKHIRDYSPKLFCLTAVTTQYPLIREVARTIREIDPSIFILLGGHHASLNPDMSAREDCFDAICIGEGEKAAVQLAFQLQSGKSPSLINNLWIRNRESGLIEKNDRDPFNCDLDSLPYIDFTMWEEWVANKANLITVLVGRGCPHKCSYCSNHSLAKLTNGKYVRFRSPENLVGELEQIVKAYPHLKGVSLRAETLSVDLEYTSLLCEGLEKFNAGLEKPLTFMLALSPRKELISDDSFLRKLVAANVKFVNIALESGSERVRNEILRRPRYTNYEIIRFCQMAAEKDINVGLCSLIGLPGETLSDFKETVRCVRACNPKHAYTFIFYPYPGTDLYTRAKKMGLFSEDILNPSVERKIARYSLPEFSRWQIQREFFLFYYNVYKGLIPFYIIGGRILRELISTSPRLNAIVKRIILLRVMKPVVRIFSTEPQHSSYFR